MPPHYHLDARVPAAGVPPSEWVSREQLEQQLIRLHGKVPDPVIGLYGPDSMMWRVGRCYIAGWLGSGRALLLQIAHPWVTQGVDHHSSTRHDPIGRARRTFINILSMTFGSLDQALAAARRVHARHDKVQGSMGYRAGGFEQGSAYRANEVNAMVWVHATLWDSALRMYELVSEPLSASDKERYYEETKLFAYLFGIPDSALPPTWPAFVDYNQRMWDSDQLAVTAATRELAAFLFKPITPLLGPVMKWMEMVTAVNLPPRLRRDFGLPYSEQMPHRFARTVKRLRFLQHKMPDRLRYSPVYFEALARIAGRRSDILTRTATRITLGRWRLVS